FVTGITGSTGAGVKPKPSTHFSWRADNVSAYKTLTHQHIDEIRLNLEKLNQAVVSLHFVPWRGAFPRGIFISATLPCNRDLKELYEIYNDFYADDNFIAVSAEAISLKQVVNTNKCAIQLEQNDDVLVVHAALDNLVKGASGQ